MANRIEYLDPKLEAVLCRLCERLGSVSVTQAVKLPYLVDVLASHLLGKPVTKGTHQTWKLGVVTSEVWSYVQHNGHPNDPFIFRSSNQFEGGKKLYLGGQPDEALEPEEEGITDFVADTWGHYDVRSLGRLTKALNTQYDSAVWGTNRPATLGEDAFARLSNSWQAFHERLSILDFSDRSHWGKAIGDPRDYLRRELGG